jgi:hypothetical protein
MIGGDCECAHASASAIALTISTARGHGIQRDASLREALLRLVHLPHPTFADEPRDEVLPNSLHVVLVRPTREDDLSLRLWSFEDR